jgi:hypothetical protein
MRKVHATTVNSWWSKLRRTTTYVVTAQFLIGTWRQGPVFAIARLSEGEENYGAG